MKTRTMRRWISIAAAAAASAAAALTGIDSMAEGPLAGRGAYADKTAFAGAGSGAGAGFGERVDSMGEDGANVGRGAFFGTAAAVYTKDVHDCVGVGYRAFRTARDMHNCVGIGAYAFADASNHVDETWINGQIEVSPTFFRVRASPGDAPILEWTNGVWTAAPPMEIPADVSFSSASAVNLSAATATVSQAVAAKLSVTDFEVGNAEGPEAVFWGDVGAEGKIESGQDVRAYGDVVAVDYDALEGVVVGASLRDLAARVAALEAALLALTNSAAASP